jgi:hypothetical protein
MTTLTLAGGMLLLTGEAAPAEPRVDLALVLVVDVSLSMEPDEQDLQRHGFAEAFQSPEVHQAIREGILGRIAVIYVEWSGAFDQQIIVPWTIIEQPADGVALAERLLQGPVHRMAYTSISGAIDFGVRQLGQSGLQADRQVIDVSGDGADNTGRTVTLARDEALAHGITINELPGWRTAQTPTNGPVTWTRPPRPPWKHRPRHAGLPLQRGGAGAGWCAWEAAPSWII